MKRINFIIFALLSIIFLFAQSCSYSDSTLDSVLDLHDGQTEKAYITFAPLQSRTILPAYSVDDMTDFVLSGTHAGNTETLGTFATKATLLSARIAIEEGSWTFTLTAKKGGSSFSGKISGVEIKMGDNPLSFSLSLDEENISAQDGKGTVSVHITFPADSGVQLVKAGLFNEETDEAISGFELEPIAITGNAITYQKEEVPAGTYRLKAFFYGDENAQVYMNTFKEIVVVAADCTSCAERSIEKLNELYSITYNLNGGNFVSGTVIPETFSRKSDIQLPAEVAISRSGYKFCGWYETEDFSGNVVSVILPGNTGTKHLYAKWAVTAETLSDFDVTSLSDGDTVFFAESLTTDTLKALHDKLASVTVDFSLDLSEATGMTTLYYRDYDSENHTYHSYFDCAKLESIVLQNDIENVNWHAFENCTNLISLIIPNGSKTSISIGSDAFKGCSNLISIILSETVSSISGSAFQGCTSLSSVTLPERIEEIQVGAFQDCTSLENIEIPSSITTLGSYIFMNCTNLKSVVISDGITIIPRGMFYNCTNLVSVSIPDSVISIGDSAFSNCSSLQTLIIPESVNSIADSAFQYCRNLAIVNIPKNVTVLATSVFGSCEKLTSITIPDSITSIGSLAFDYCTTLSTITFTGTKSQWNAIPKGGSWNSGVPAKKVICSDGEMEL